MVIQDKKIFITGGAGFIANTIIGRLANENKIIVYDNFHRDTLSGSVYAAHPNIEIIKGDVLNFDSLCKAMQGANIVVHAAGIAGIDTVVKRPAHTMRVNMMGTAYALEAAKINGVKDRFIDFSTSEVFGKTAYKSKEEDEAVSGKVGEPRWVYAVSKLAGEHLAHAYHQQYGLPVVTVRPFNVYGPGQTGEGAIQVFIKKALKQEEIFINGDGTQIRAWCYVDDFVDCLIRCLENEKAIGNSFNLGNAKAISTTLGLAETVCRVVNSTSKICFRPALAADVEIRIPNVEKAEQLLGFKATVGLEAGIRRTAEWFTKNNRLEL